MLFKALSFSLVTFRAVGINQKKRMMYYIRNERSLKMQRITALELKPGPKKCIVIVHNLDAVRSSQIFFPNQNLERAY